MRSTIKSSKEVMERLRQGDTLEWSLRHEYWQLDVCDAGGCTVGFDKVPEELVAELREKGLITIEDGYIYLKSTSDK